MTTPWNQRYAQRVQRMSGSTIRELLKYTENPNLISFAGGMPAPEVFPIKEFQVAAERVLSRYGSLALQYSTTEGYPPLREWIVSTMSRYGIEASPDNVLITSGSQQALDLIGKILINPGDLILTEQPTYLGALQAWRAYQAEFLSVPVDEEGLRTDLLEEALCAGPKFMYILPNFQNPAGVTLSFERRKRLIEIADRYGVPIIEDDPYGELRYEGEHLPPLVVIDADRLAQRAERVSRAGGDCRGNGKASHCLMRGNVIYLSTFSKTLAPGIRLAWIVAPVEVIQRGIMAKQGMDLHTSTLVQMLAYELLTQREGESEFLANHIRTIRDTYRERRDVMLEAMETYFPEGVQWTRPQGGLFLWVTLPAGLDTAALLQDAIANNVAYVPGNCFHPDGCGDNSFRLNFSYSKPELIVVGIRRLGEVISRALEKAAAEQRQTGHELRSAGRQRPKRRQPEATTRYPTMETSIIISGFGGQGVLFAGQLLAYAGMDNGREVTWIPSYGPEMRGGTAHCIVIISDEPIGAPVVARPDIAVVLNQPSFDKYLPAVAPGGLLVVNSSLVESLTSRDDIDIVRVPANAVAEEWGTPKMLNMAAIGAMLAARPVLPLKAMEETLRAHLPHGKQNLVDANIQVLRHGFAVLSPAA